MGRVFIATLGFEEKWVVRMMVRHGIGKGDEVVLLTWRRVDRAERAVKAVEDFIAKYYGGEVELRVVDVPVDRFWEAVSTIAGVLRRARGDSVLLNVSGGMRALVAEALAAALVAGPPGLVVEVEAEDSSFIAGFGVEELRALAWAPTVLTEQRRKIIEVLAREPGLTAEELAEKLGINVSTVRKHLDALAEHGLVEREGKPYRWRATGLARAVLAAVKS